jgi:TM2 domain-containing membrane protein YozV
MSALPNTHSKAVGYLLWIFGFMGAHRFYYGRQVTGVIWFCTAGLLLVGWIIDLFFDSWSRRGSALRGGADQFLGCVDSADVSGLAGNSPLLHAQMENGILYLLTLGLLGIGVLYDFLTRIAHELRFAHLWLEETGAVFERLPVVAVPAPHEPQAVFTIADEIREQVCTPGHGGFRFGTSGARRKQHCGKREHDHHTDCGFRDPLIHPKFLS